MFLTSYGLRHTNNDSGNCGETYLLNGAAEKRIQTRAALLAIIVFVVLISEASAQNTLDLTGGRAPSEAAVAHGRNVTRATRGLSGSRPTPLPLEVAVVSFTSTDLMPGMRLVFEVSLKNTGTVPVDIPWTDVLHIPTPMGDDQVDLYLTVTIPDASGRAHVLVGTVVSGNAFDRSVLTLEPGEIANIRAGGNVKVGDALSLTSNPVDVNLTVKVLVTRGGILTEEVSSEVVPAQLRARPKEEMEPQP